MVDSKKVQVVFPLKQWEIVSSLNEIMGGTDSEIVRNIVISWLSEKGYMNANRNDAAVYILMERGSNKKLANDIVTIFQPLTRPLLDDAEDKRRKRSKNLSEYYLEKCWNEILHKYAPPAKRNLEISIKEKKSPEKENVLKNFEEAQELIIRSIPDFNDIRRKRGLKTFEINEYWDHFMDKIQGGKNDGT